MAQLISRDEHIVELQESLNGTAKSMDHLDRPDTDLEASEAHVVRLEGELAKAMENANKVNELRSYI